MAAGATTPLDNEGTPIVSLLSFRDAYTAAHQTSSAEELLNHVINQLFSEAELDELLTVYSSPLMKRMRAITQGIEEFLLMSPEERVEMRVRRA